MKLTFGKPANAAVWKTLFTTTALHVLIDLEHDDAREVLARVRLLPELALGLQDVEELVDALHAVRLLDRPRVAGGRAVDEDLAADDRDDRRVDHVERVLRLGQVDALGDRRLAARAEGHQQEDDGHDEEVDHARERQTRVGRAVSVPRDLLLDELEPDVMHQAAAGLDDQASALSLSSPRR